jgi:hypothetical protein
VNWPSTAATLLAMHPADGGGLGFLGVVGAEGAAEGEVGDVEVVGRIAVLVGVGGVFEGLEDDAGGGQAAASEDLDGMEGCLGRDPRAHAPPVCGGGKVVGSLEGLAVREDALPCGNARDVAAVTVGGGVQRVRVGSGQGVGAAGGVVVVAHEVGSARHLRRREGTRLHHGGVVAEVVRLRAGTAEVGMKVIHAGVDDPDAQAVSRERRRGGPCGRGAHEGDARGRGPGMMLLLKDAGDVRKGGQGRLGGGGHLDPCAMLEEVPCHEDAPTPLGDRSGEA